MATVGVVAALYLGGQLLYRLRDIVILMAMSGFIALILNPLVVVLQRRVAPRRSAAVAIVTVSALLVFAGLAVGCGYPLAAGITHMTGRLPGYVASAEHGNGWLGHLLRRLSIDEVPQLLNVVRGEMSLVGPRPALAWEAELVGSAYLPRFTVLPGLTGLWQVEARAHATFAEALDLDATYARGLSWGLDLRLFLRTPLVLLRKRDTA